MLSIRAEYGSWEHVVYWSASVDLTARLLSVQGPDGGSQSFQLTEEQASLFFRDADKFKIWALPTSQYPVDHSDDLYHMGVSLEVESADGLNRLKHLVPTGQVVMVPTRRVSKTNYIAFSSYVQICVRRIVEISKISPPEHILVKWKSRSHLDGLE